jgi:hypothetical protein
MGAKVYCQTEQITQTRGTKDSGVPNGFGKKFTRGLKNLKSFGNLNLLVPGLEVLEICGNHIKSHVDIGILVMEILFFIMSQLFI